MDAQTRRDLATKIAAERKARKMTQREVAHAAGVSLGTVSNAELGKAVTQAANLRAILSVLDIVEPHDVDLQSVNGNGPAAPEDEPSSLSTCPKCRRVLWPMHYQLFFDSLGAHFDVLTDEEVYEFMSREMRGMMDRR